MFGSGWQETRKRILELRRLVTMPRRKRGDEVVPPRRRAKAIGMAERVLPLLIAYEFVIKPILVRVCGERYLAINIIIN